MKNKIYLDKSTYWLNCYNKINGLNLKQYNKLKRISEL